MMPKKFNGTGNPKHTGDGGTQRIGYAWLKCASKISEDNATKFVTIKSVTVKRRVTEEIWHGHYMILVRGRYGMQDVIKYRILNNLDNFPHVLADMLSGDLDWREDKYGSTIVFNEDY